MSAFTAGSNKLTVDGPRNTHSRSKVRLEQYQSAYYPQNGKIGIINPSIPFCCGFAQALAIKTTIDNFTTSEG